MPANACQQKQPYTKYVSLLKRNQKIRWTVAGFHYSLQFLNIGYLLFAVMTSNDLAVNSYH